MHSLDCYTGTLSRILKVFTPFYPFLSLLLPPPESRLLARVIWYMQDAGTDAPKIIECS
jgi:hypothetical protein